MDTNAQIDVVTADLGRLVAATRAGQLHDATPCAKWQVKDLLAHLVGGLRFFAAALRGQDPGDLSGDVLGDDPSSAYEAAAEDFRAAVREAGAMERTITLGFGEMPGAAFARLAVFDLLVHSWDLATASGQEFSPDAAIVADADEFARTSIPPHARDGDTFAPEVELDSDATPIQRLAALAGRQVP